MADEKNYVIHTEGLTKVFRDFWGQSRVVAVDDLDLDIRPHEVFGLLGPNGSGKSTTIKMLLGLLHMTRGRAWVMGQLPGDVKTNARIGYLPEESYLYPYLNARETLDFYARLFGLSRSQRKARVDSLIDMVGLTSAARRPIAEYSKGMIRRIGLAQALINDPELLILDEPTSGLDPIGTRQIKDLICELGKRGKTVLLCSHLLADVEDVCDRICILYGGKIQSIGTVDEMLASQDATQIVSPRLKPEVISQIETIIKKECNKDDISVSTPRNRLEDVFLKIVADAQASKVATHGASMGGEVSSFLGDVERNQGQNLIDGLVEAKEPDFDALKAERDQAVAKEAELVAVETQKVQKQVLSSLVETDTVQLDDVKSDSSDQKDSGDSLTTTVNPNQTPPVDDKKVNRSVLDGLIDNPDFDKKNQDKQK